MKTNSKSVPYMIIAANYKALSRAFMQRNCEMLKRDLPAESARERISRGKLVLSLRDILMRKMYKMPSAFTNPPGIPLFITRNWKAIFI